MENRRKRKFFTTAELADHLGAELCGTRSLQITNVNSIEQAFEADVSFITSAGQAEKLIDTKAGAVIVPEKIDGAAFAQLVVKNVQEALIKALNLFAPKLTGLGGVHPAAIIEESARIGENAAIGAGAYISHKAQIGAGSIISGGCMVGENTIVGENCRLDANVVIYHNCKIGNNCIIQANTTIGSTGFGYYFIDGQHKLIPHNGGVVIEDCVEIGANCCVDRAKFGDTIIGAGTKIDNLVQIAHNVVIGKCCVLAGQVGLSGSCRLGDGVVMGGQAGVSDHINIGHGAALGARSGVISDIPAGVQVVGLPATELKDQLRIWAMTKRLPNMAKQLKKVLKKVEKLETAEDDKK